MHRCVYVWRTDQLQACCLLIERMMGDGFSAASHWPAQLSLTERGALRRRILNCVTSSRITEHPYQFFHSRTWIELSLLLTIFLGSRIIVCHVAVDYL